MLGQSEGLAFVWSPDGLRGYVNKKGQWVFKTQGTFGGPFSGGLAAVQIGRKFGYVNRTGRVVIPARAPLSPALRAYFEAYQQRLGEGR